MRKLLSALFVFTAFFAISQAQSPDCSAAENVCANNGSLFPLSIGQGVVDIPAGNNISNPSSNPQGVNMGCLFSNELNPNWFVINIGQGGNLEFTIGQAGGGGFFDWAMWPYDPSSSCNGITNNTLPPVSCNWNAASQGFTGMWNGGPPPGGNAGNFQPSLNVQAGEAYVLMFSNYSSLSGFAQLSFPTNPGSAVVTCQPGTPDQTICLGNAAVVDIIPPPTVTSPTFNWLVTNGVSNPTGGTGVIVNPTVTTEYHVEIFDPLLPGGVMVDTFTITVENQPAPNAGLDQNVCFGNPIQLNGVPANPANSCQWSYNANGIVPAPSVNFSPNASNMNASVSVNQTGTYLFILTESNPICGAVRDTAVVVVSELAISAVTVSPSCQGYNDGEIHINSPEAVEYSFDGGMTWIVDSFDVVNNIAGTYFVCARSALGCQKCINATITAPAPVTISVSNDTLICQNGTAYMSATATGGTSYSYHWDHTASTLPTQNVNPLVATTYTVYSENQNGCVSAPATIDVTVRAPLTGNISPYDTICPGYPTDILADVTGGIGMPYHFVWTSGEVSNGPASHQIIANPPSTQMYTVTITDECESTPLVMSTEIYVAPLPVPQYEVLDPEQCEPAVFHIINTTDPALSQYNYWLVDNEHQYINQDTIATPEFYEGTYDMQMIITTYHGCVDSLTFMDALSVKPKPIASFQHSPNPVQMFNTNVVFTSTSFLAHEYDWYFEQGYPSWSGQASVLTQFPDGETGTYDVQLVVTSELGCKDTVDYELIVFPEVLIFAPNTFTPDGDEFNQHWMVHIVGVDIYDFDLLIFDRWGQLVWESHDPSIPWDGTLNGEPLPVGQYNWAITTKDLLNDGKYTYNGHVNIIR